MISLTPILAWVPYLTVVMYALANSNTAAVFSGCNNGLWISVLLQSMSTFAVASMAVYVIEWRETGCVQITAFVSIVLIFLISVSFTNSAMLWAPCYQALQEASNTNPALLIVVSWVYIAAAAVYIWLQIVYWVFGCCGNV